MREDRSDQKNAKKNVIKDICETTLLLDVSLIIFDFQLRPSLFPLCRKWIMTGLYCFRALKIDVAQIQPPNVGYLSNVS